MLSLPTRLIGEFGKEEHSEHLVVAVIVGGVEELGGLTDLAYQSDATGQFLTDLTHQRLLGSFARQGAATGQSEHAATSHSSYRAVLASDDRIGCRSFGVCHTFPWLPECHGRLVADEDD